MKFMRYPKNRHKIHMRFYLFTSTHKELLFSCLGPVTRSRPSHSSNNFSQGLKGVKAWNALCVSLDSLGCLLMPIIPALTSNLEKVIL